MKVFLSYARDDDEAFVGRLADDLAGRSFAVWFDRRNMPSRSLTFMEEIRRAIDDADRLVVVLGPASISSEYVRSEWQYALARAKAVTPILRLGDYTIQPAELRGFHCPDCRRHRTEREAFEEVARLLSDPVPVLGLVHGAPSLPPHFRPRPNELSDLTTRVLGDQTDPRVIDAWSRLTVVSGMGGVGKSVLAAAFARSTRVRRVFTDGIYWKDARNNPDPADLTEALARDLGRHQASQPETVHALQSPADRLRERLRDQRCLVVLDNVSGITQVEELARCLDTTGRLLVTTREANLVDGTGAVLVGGLVETDGCEFLVDWIGDDTPRDEIRFLVRRCEGLPFALALCGAMVTSGVPIEAIVERLRATDLRFLEKQFPEYTYPSLLPMLDASMQSLRERDAGAAERFETLAIFREGALAPRSVIHRMWAHGATLSEGQTSKFLVLFKDLSLIRLESAPEEPVVVLHPLMHDYLVELARDLSLLHQRLLDAYAEATGPYLVEGPDDGYYHANLGYHLLGANRHDDFYSLLVDSPEWMRAKEYDKSRRGSFLADVDLAIDSIDVIEDKPGLGILTRLFAARHVAQRGPSAWGEPILRTMVLLGEERAALLAARSNVDRHASMCQLLVIHEELQRQGRSTPELIDEAQALCDSEIGPAHRAKMRASLIEWLVRADDLDRALELWETSERSSKTEDHPTMVLAMLLARRGSFSEARRIVATSSTATRLLVDVQESLTVDDVGQAEHVVSVMPEGLERDLALTMTASALVSAGKHAKAQRFAQQLKGVERIVALAAIPNERCVAEALTGARALEDLSQRVIALPACAEALDRLAKAEQPVSRSRWRFPWLWRSRHVQAREDARAIVIEAARLAEQLEPSQRVTLLRFLAEQALRREREEDAVRLRNEWRVAIEALNDPRQRAEELAQFAHFVASSGDTVGARPLLDDAVRASETFDAPSNAEAALAAVLPALVRGDLFPIALSRALAIRKDHIRSKVIGLLAATCGDEGRFAEAERLLKARVDDDAEELQRQYAKALAKVGDAESSLRVAEQLPAAARGPILPDIAVALADTGQTARALQVIDSLFTAGVGVYWRVVALCAFARAATPSAAISISESALSRVEPAIAEASGLELVLCLAALGSAVSQLQPGKAPSVFERAVRAALRVEDDGLGDSFLFGVTSSYRAIEAVGSALLESGRVDDVLRLARSVQARDDSAWRSLQASLVACAAVVSSEERAERGTALFEEALRHARAAENSILGRPWRLAAFHNVATHLWEAGRWRWALEVLGQASPSVDAYIAGFAGWCEPTDSNRPGLTLRHLTDIISIVGWIRPDWSDLASEITASTTNPARSGFVHP